MALLTDLQAHWKCEEAADSSALVDAHGENDMASGVGSEPGSATGKIDLGRDFEQSSFDRFSIANNATIAVAGKSFRVSMWFKPETVAAGGALILKDDNSSTGNFWLVIDDGISPGVAAAGNLVAVISDGASEFVLLDAGALSVGTWHFLEMAYDATANILYAAIDGGTPVSVSGGAAVPAGDAGSLRIGLSTYFGTPSPDGVLDEISYFVGPGAIKDATDRAAQYNAGAGLPLEEWDAVVEPSGPSQRDKIIAYVMCM